MVVNECTVAQKIDTEHGISSYASDKSCNQAIEDNKEYVDKLTMHSKIMTTRFKDPADYRETGELSPYFTNRLKTGITSTLSQTFRYSCI